MLEHASTNAECTSAAISTAASGHRRRAICAAGHRLPCVKAIWPRHQHQRAELRVFALTDSSFAGGEWLRAPVPPAAGSLPELPAWAVAGDDLPRCRRSHRRRAGFPVPTYKATLQLFAPDWRAAVTGGTTAESPSPVTSIGEVPPWGARRHKAARAVSSETALYGHGRSRRRRGAGRTDSGKPPRPSPQPTWFVLTIPR